jgi:hypothetical protein
MTILGYIFVSFGLGKILIRVFFKNGDRLHVQEAGHLWLFEGMLV